MNFEKTKEQISLHGLGFIQVILPGASRLHIWHPELPRRKCYEHSKIHDHRFGFTSQVLRGIQLNQFYRVEKYPPLNNSGKRYFGYRHEGPRTKFGNRPWDRDFVAWVKPVGDQRVIYPGDSYSVNPYIYHSTEPGSEDKITVTLMTKTEEHSEGAHSLCEANVEPDVNFDRKQMSSDDLWAIVTESLKI